VETEAGVDLGRPGLEGDRVAADGGEVLIIQPTHGRLVALQTDGGGVILGALFAFGGAREAA